MKIIHQCREVSSCARKVSQRGFTYFGLQFYGECWSGENATKTFNKLGSTDRCLMVVNNKDYKKCNNSVNELCTGVEFSNYVYKIVHAGMLVHCSQLQLSVFLCFRKLVNEI